MPKLLTTQYRIYEFTDEEAQQAQILHPALLAAIETRLSETMAERFSLTLDPNDVNSFIQQEAYLKAKMDIYQELLDNHRRVTDKLNAPSLGSPNSDDQEFDLSN